MVTKSRLCERYFDGRNLLVKGQDVREWTLRRDSILVDLEVRLGIMVLPVLALTIHAGCRPEAGNVEV